jgi:hypothetical protein
MSSANSSTASPNAPGEATTSLDKITPPKNLGKQEKRVVFEYIFRQLARFRNTASIHAELEAQYEVIAASASNNAGSDSKAPLEDQAESQDWKPEYDAAVNEWAQSLLRNAWTACTEEAEGGFQIVLASGN